MFKAASEATRIRQYSQTCPTGNPYRCITSGKCVQSAFRCMLTESLAFTSSFYGQSFSGNFLDAHCSSSTPVRCIDGTCVESYQKCIPSDVDVNVFASPIAWGAEYVSNTTNFCKVYCQDGSCRDRQENCPLI